jgi:single-stranded-DNA-specific exonuclease
MGAAPLPARRWVFPEAGAGEAALERECGVSPLIARLLSRRGIQTPEAAARFLDPRLQSLADPFQLTDLRAAAERIARALVRRETIAVFGDYDVDGITSAALLVRVLTALGGQASAFLPHRVSEGYGLTRAAAARCLAEKRPDLLIAVDCGTSSREEIAWITGQGVAVVVVDHHELPPALPACDALVNPHRDGQFTYLASVGLVFKLCHGLLKLDASYRERVDLRDYLDLVALGTVADLVPLREENRIYVRHGLLRLDQTKLLGLRALAKVAAVKSPATADDIGFRLGPRLNASGRLDDAGESLRLLLTDDPAEAERLAAGLDRQNRERQDLEQKTLDEASAHLAEHFAGEWGIVLGRRGWHIGVIGIVASRIQRLYGRPAIIIGFDENGDGKGSCRSVEGCRIVDGLRDADGLGLLDRFGGHEMAAGLSIREEKLDAFRAAFNAWLRRTATDDILQPRLHIDGELRVAEIDDALFRDLARLAPFGRENPQPVFALRGVPMSRPPQTIKEKHLKLFLGDSLRGCEAIGFGFATRQMPMGPLSLAGSVEWDDYKGRVQLRLIDWRAE